MKTNIKTLQTTILLLFFFLPCFITAQCSPGNLLTCSSAGTFPINNNRSCDVTVQIEVSECQAATACNGSGVVYTTVVNIPGMSTFNTPVCKPNPASPAVTILGCPCGGDISVWVKEINGIDVTSGGHNYYQVSGQNCLSAMGGSNVTTSVPGTVPAPCNFPGNYNVVFTGTSVDIN